MGECETCAKLSAGMEQSAAKLAAQIGTVMHCRDCGRVYETSADRIAALIEAGDRLNELACHQDDCQIVTHGVWSDPIPCTCGYTEAWKKWKEVRGE